ncbi:phosphate/phosphite/phosphonate ABC transporter substrate-binding protein [Mesorhizobium sp. B4-1-4]|uniref:phosphate/phosphite/phosphonate ABC transporter substrate-binding protein n=1 Tax=Mesorhizobium sp. B4-1-4 TaxID=2589888 RepID=UPI001129D964|nr:phosphate/phosphite/phosphonate ABC transporter substrate-binding protein [Mesorhizobium sp. B4-1-4]UCI32020.1 phosphate/phosphite/phosphonate ABC transporter substrate-binding protein [Mesorhizobium sp. B4-1-4]
MLATLTRRATLFGLAVMSSFVLVEPGLAQDRTGWPKELRFAIVPNEGEKVIDAYTKILAHVQKQIGIPITTYKVTDVAAVIVAMANGQVDAGRIGAEAYVLAQKNAGAEAIAVESTKAGGTGYRGSLWVRADSGIESLEAARGKSLAFSDPNSTSGYLVVMDHFINKLNIRPENYFSKVIFAGGALPSIEALVNGKVDVAAFSDTYKSVAVKQGVAKEADLRAVWTSELIQNPPYVLRATLPASLKKAYQDALVSFADPVVLDALPGGVAKIVIATDKDYDSTRKLDEVKRTLSSIKK